MTATTSPALATPPTMSPPPHIHHDPRKSHSFVCCDMDHGSSSKAPVLPADDCPFEAYCCLDEHCSPAAPCTQDCADACDASCVESCVEPCSGNCVDACDDPNCVPVEGCCPPLSQGSGDPPWCPPGCTIEEYVGECWSPADDQIQRCADAACQLPRVNVDPLALPFLPSQPLTQPFFDGLSAALDNVANGQNKQGVAPSSGHVCHWQNCHRTFDSMGSLLGHLATDHLSKPPPAIHHNTPASNLTVTPQGSAQNTPAPQPVVPPQQHQRAPAPLAQQLQQPNGRPLPCLWDDCFPFGQLNGNAAAVGQSPSSAGGGGMAQSQQPLTMLPQQLPSGGARLPCLWDDCFPFGQLSSNEAAAGMNQSGQQAFAQPHSHTHADGSPLSPQTMLRHLLEEHLGVPTDMWADPANSGHAHLILTHHHQGLHDAAHNHVNSQHFTSHAPHPALGHKPASCAQHDVHGHAHSHAAMAPGHHHHPVKLPPTPLLTPPGDGKEHMCLWPGCTERQPFASSGDLMEHLSEVHVGRGKDSYRCFWDGCGGPEGRLFSSRQKVLRHLQSHTGHRPFVCSVCSQSFSEAAPLAAHMRRHADDKPFVCDHPGCGKAFAISSSLTIHKVCWLHSWLTLAYPQRRPAIHLPPLRQGVRRSLKPHQAHPDA